MIGRVRDRATFEAFRHRSRRVRRGPVTLVHVPGEDAPPRVAFGVGRKVGPAVVRNKIRRRLRQIMRDLSRDGRLPPGAYLVVVRPEAAREPYSELARLVASACEEVDR